MQDLTLKHIRIIETLARPMPDFELLNGLLPPELSLDSWEPTTLTTLTTLSKFGFKDHAEEILL